MEPSRKEIWRMFDRISPTYDLVNRILSLGLDQRWRKKVGLYLPERQNLSLLDCATGTADQLLSLIDSSPRITEAIGIDLATEMLEIGQKKVKKRGYEAKAMLQEASATALPFESERFDCVTISFGIRNVTDISLCLNEIHRVLKPQGRVLILEFSLPKNKIVKLGHLFYLRHLLPILGGWISRDKAAYAYLNQTIETFPYGEKFCALLSEHGFKHTQAHPLTFGAATIYQGDK